MAEESTEPKAEPLFPDANPMDAHTHEMTQEFIEDMALLQLTIDSLSASDTKRVLQTKKDDFMAKAVEVSEKISDLREHIQKKSEPVNYHKRDLGLWAAGLGKDIMKYGHKLGHAATPGKAIAAGKATMDLFSQLRTEVNGTNVLASLILTAINEGTANGSLSQPIIDALHGFRDKIIKYSVKTVPPPPYYWPSTYVSSSSAVGSSGSSYPSSSTWPPAPSTSSAP